MPNSNTNRILWCWDISNKTS